MEESNPRVRHGFVLLSKIDSLSPADQPMPTMQWLDASRIMGVEVGTPYLSFPTWRTAYCFVKLEPPGEVIMVTETAEEVIDLVAQARDRLMPFERPVEFTTTNELEEILADQTERKIVILPDGSIRAE